MSNRFFITGTGTGIGKTVISAILTEALHADYWKPVQAGFDEGIIRLSEAKEGTDSEWVKNIISNKKSRFHSEAYKLKLAASPHIAARRENIIIDLSRIAQQIPAADNLIVEGAGGLMVPLNDNEFVIDLVKLLRIKVIIVSKNELGSINHSLLTASVCKQHDIDVAGWIFNGNYMNYEEEIVRWTGIPAIASVPHTDNLGKEFILSQAAQIAKRFNFFS